MNLANTQHHIIPLRTYFRVFIALIILTGVTIGVSFIDLGGFNMVTALIIAGAKASLVAMFFMHLLYDRKMNLAIFLTAILHHFYRNCCITCCIF